MRAVELVACRKHQFLMVGQRWDVDLKEPLDFNSDWENWLQTYIVEHAQLHPITGIDYFVFRRGLWKEIPPFAIGRTAWDNWLIYEARVQSVPVIDATQSIIIIHQNHNYAHIRHSIKGELNGPEIERNVVLAGGRQNIFTLQDVTWLLSKRGLRPALTPWHLRRHPMAWLACHPYLRAKLKAIRNLFRSLW
jgi:hypothetical protein